MHVAMTTEPWLPRGRRHRPTTPISTSCRRIGPREDSHSPLHETKSRFTPTTTSAAAGSQPAKSRSLAAGSRQRRWIQVWGYLFLLLLLLCTERGFCAGLAPAGESVPSRPSPPSFSGQREEEEEDPLARLSRVFGIKRIPAKVFHRTPPQYMTELFQEVADSGGLTKASGPYNANTIRSFPDRDSVRQEHYFYNVSRLQPQESSDEERMLGAEFHIFKMKPRPKRAAEAPPPHHLQLKLYQVLDKSKMNLPEGLRLIDTQRISTHKHGWITFKVSKAVESWRLRPQENHGLLVVAMSPRGQPYKGSYFRFAQRNQHHDSKQPILVVFSEDAASERHPTFVSPDDQDYKEILAEMNERQLQKSAEEKRKEAPETTPQTTPAVETGSNSTDSGRKLNFQQAVYMLNEQAREELTLPQPSSAPPRGRRRSKRQANAGSSKRKRQGGRRKRTYRLGGYRYRRSCSKHKMYVDFDEIGWSGWIISPKGYDAYFCTGECPFPLGQSQKPTNHATVQSIVHALGVGAKNLGTPCCVPNKLFSISLLYFDDDENVILKQYDDMVAASCGCH